MPEITLSAVTKHFRGARAREVVALDGVDLQVHDRELIVLTGPSGCGKTTLLRLIAGLEAPDSGTIQLDSKQLRAGDPGSHKTAMIFQHQALYPSMDVAENLTFGLKVRRVDKQSAQQKVQSAAELTGISGLLNRHPHELSGGEAQRVALARALVLEPSLLLLDEPLSSVDAQGRAALRDDIMRLQRRLGMTMVYVTHDQFEAMAVGDRIAILRDGKLRQAGTPAEIYDRPADPFVAGFFGSPRMNLLKCIASGSIVSFGQQGDPSSRVEVECALPLTGSVLIGLRPEHLQVAASAASGALRLPVRVESVRFAGAEEHVLCVMAGQQILVRTARGSSPKVGQEVVLVANPKHVKVFKNTAPDS